MTQTYRLHYAPDNASLIIRLALEELGLSYETSLVDRRSRAQDGAAYRRLNPNGLIPVLETPDGPMFETAAILLWLADRHGALAPEAISPERAAFLKWLFFASNTLHADLRMSFYPEKYIGSDPSHHAALRAGLRERLKAHLGHLDDLASQDLSWFGAETPSALDYYIAPMLRWMALYPEQGDRSWYDLSTYPHLHALLSKLESRPAVHAAIKAEGLGETPFTKPLPANPPEGSAT
ncbi:glutathione S-transferase family protein [Roseobacter sp. SK209-2-6]|uniref:glutathione S-transferase family protein n=1 Tax=Roseobacter sp. SK209-2-6 TaxID=388739 RepID=UPI0000F3EB49|nr:glutathione S-transferase family protein [Roseobacter sp. SK209-2-6]EBA15532.1 glutathione S-transferase family protein [Roseobacter sp. SK209-2-6]